MSLDWRTEAQELQLSSPDFLVAIADSWVGNRAADIELAPIVDAGFAGAA